MKKGFTLIELLIVVVIVGTLMAVAVPKFHVALEKGRSQEGVVYMKKLADELNAYYWMWGRYPRGQIFFENTDFNKFLADAELPKLTHFTPEDDFGCADDGTSCVAYLDRDGGDMYSIYLHISLGEVDQIRCDSCQQIGPSLMRCDPNRENYKRYCSVIGKETQIPTGNSYSTQYLIVGQVL